MSDCFGRVVVGDFEYETSGGDFDLIAGDLPRVLCGVFHVLDANLRHVRTIRQWRGEFGAAPPFDIGDDTLFVAYSAWAELTCFLQLGWTFPKHVYDLHTAYLAASNVLAPLRSRQPAQTRTQTTSRRLQSLWDRRLGANRQGNDGAGHR